MNEERYIRVMMDPYARHESRGYCRHNMYSLCNRVFKLLNPNPVDEEVVSTIDHSVTTQKCYIFSRDEFLRVAPEFEGVSEIGTTFAIPVEFAVPWHPEGLINPVTGKGMGLEEGVRKSIRWKEEAKKLGISENPFTLK